MTNEQKFEVVSFEDVKVGDVIRVTFKSGSALQGEVTDLYRTRIPIWIEVPGFSFGVADAEKVERLVKPFEPHWGMVIGDPDIGGRRLVYLPGHKHDAYPWLGQLSITSKNNWHRDETAKKLLNEDGWEVIEKPEGVK